MLYLHSQNVENDTDIIIKTVILLIKPGLDILKATKLEVQSPKMWKWYSIIILKCMRQ